MALPPAPPGAPPNLAIQHINVDSILNNQTANPINIPPINSAPFNNPPLESDPQFDEQQREQWLNHTQTSEQYQTLWNERQRLPIYSRENENLFEDITTALETHPLVFVNGIPAAGKTTQLPQRILDNALRNGRASQTYILVALPQNLAVWALAERVAEERDQPQPQIGNGYRILNQDEIQVGYKAFGQLKLPRKRGSIFFLTYNSLRLWFERNPAMNNVSHVILDEVDVRDTNVDKCLRLLNLSFNPNLERPDLKVMLISTKDYFPTIRSYFSNVQSRAIDIHMREPTIDSHTVDTLKYTTDDRGRACYTEATIKTLKDWNLDVHHGLEIELIAQLAINVCHQIVQGNVQQRGQSGNILIFMAEFEAIQQVVDRIKELLNVNRLHNFSIHFMHSEVEMNKLQMIFRPSQYIKIIVASNLAETAITIPGVCHVIDCGMTKMTKFSPAVNIENFRPYTSANSNAMNRARAAGRTSTRHGDVYRIFTQPTFDGMKPYHPPEFERISLSNELLVLKATGYVLNAFLDQLPSPPGQPTRRLGGRDLVETDFATVAQDGQVAQAEAIQGEDDGDLTPLGRLASKLVSVTGDLRYGKMLILGVVMSCVKPIVSIVAFLSVKDPFRLQLDDDLDYRNNKKVAEEIARVEAQIAGYRQSFARGSRSDHIMLLNIMEEFLSEEPEHREPWATNHYIDHSIMIRIVEKRKNLIKELKSRGILHRSYHDNDRWFDERSGETSLIHAIICRAFGTCKIALRHQKKRYKIATHTATLDAHIQQGSVNDCCFRSQCFCDRPQNRYLIFGHAHYTEIDWTENQENLHHISLKGTLRETTAVGPLTIMLFGARKLTYNEQNGVLQADGFSFQCNQAKAMQIITAKHSLEQFIQLQIGLITSESNVTHGLGHLRSVFARISEENDWICC